MTIKFQLDDPEVVKIIDSHDQEFKITTGVQAVLTGRLTKALYDHSEALSNAAAASDKYASQLVGVTGRLSWVTSALVLVAGVQIFLSWYWR